MTSSSAILYPTIKGLESSNSSFVQVSQPIRDVSRNLASNYRRSASKAEREQKSKQSKPHEFAERNEDISTNRRQQREHLSKAQILVDKELFVNHGTSFEPLNRYGKASDADFKSRLKVEKSQQYDIAESGMMTADHSAIEKEKQSEEITELSLMKPESVHGLINKHPKHTIIINNTFINRSPNEQEEFLAKFSPTFYSQNPNVVSVRNVLPSVTENDKDPLTDGGQHGMSKPVKDRSTDVEEFNFDSDDPKTESPSIDESVPLVSIITGILWIFLILIYLFLLYLKVMNVNYPLPKIIPKPKPSNYEFCMMVIRRLRTLIGELWRF